MSRPASVVQFKSVVDTCEIVLAFDWIIDIVLVSDWITDIVLVSAWITDIVLVSD